jgi:hypothetical protein
MMKIQFLKVFDGPPYELEKVRIPCKADVPADFDVDTLYGPNWHAEQVQILHNFGGAV